MNDNVLYELVVEKKHLNLIKQSLSLQINNLYEAVDADVVNAEKAYEDIKVLSDMLAVLRSSGRIVKQTSETTGLIWLKEAFAPQDSQPLQKSDEQRQKELNAYAEYAESCLENFLKNHHKEGNSNPSKAWNNVKERHWDTIKRTGEK
jgi:hypothetical protein